MSNDVTSWLGQLGLGAYAALFAENDIDWQLLPELDQETLKDIGITSAGHRLRILKAAGSLKSESTNRQHVPEKEIAKAPFVASQAVAERRQLTVMFCDLVGSTTLAEQLDLEEFRDIIRSYQDACVGAITRFEGYVARFVGDGLLVYFGFPRAHEDDAERAIRAALGIFSAVQSLSSRLGRTLEVRVGIATGRVVVGDIVGDAAAQEQAVIGETPNLAARLQAAAAANTIVISAGTRELIGEQFKLEVLGARKLKGISVPVRAWRVLKEQAVESRFGATHAGRLTTFVGREQEVALLLERWRQARTGEGQMVLLSGEAGIGKSRIIHALRGRLQNEGHIDVQYQCSPHHTNSPLNPAIQHLASASGIKTEDTSEKKLEKLEAFLHRSSAPRDAVEYLAALLSIPVSDRNRQKQTTPQEQKQKTLLALSGLLEGFTREQPVLFIFEDAHWIDPTTEELMELIADRVRTLPVLVLVTHRPEHEPPWAGHAHCTVLALNRLGLGAIYRHRCWSRSSPKPTGCPCSSRS
jgi:class 3 adenylate cyclase/ABC-type transport system involved in cytochrome c biogenesis ATPase subunit